MCKLTGSTLLDDSKSAFLFILFKTFVLMCLVMLIANTELIINNNCFQQLNIFFKNQVYYFKFLLNAEDIGSDRSISKVRIFGEELLTVSKFSVFFFGAILLFTAPIYILKLLGVGESHTYQYGWLINLVYMRGQLIAVMMMLAWICLITLLFVLYYKCDMKRLETQHGEAVKKNPAITVDDIFNQSEKPFDFKLYLQLFIMGSVNLFIVVLVNGTYIYATYQNLDTSTTFYMQFGLASFKMLYNKCVPLLTLQICDVKTNIAVRSMLNIFNNLFIPCVAAAFTSPACYQVPTRIL